MALLATALVCTALSAGCGGPAAAAPQLGAQPASQFAIAFKRSGGLRASVETLVVRPGLRAFATAPKGDRRASAHFRMKASTAAAVGRQLAAAGFAALQSPASPATCNDCYAYTLTYRGHTVRFDSGDEIPEGLMEAVDMLEGEVIAHLYRHVGFRPG